jgi:hypothetical protein
MAAVHAAVIEMAAGHKAMAWFKAGVASIHLKELNAEKRRAKPPSAARDTPPVEYLYTHSNRYQIVKRTKQRVYYLKTGERIDEHGEPTGEPNYDREGAIGFITLDELENGPRRGNDYRLFYATFEPIREERRHHDEYWRQQRAKYLAEHGVVPPDEIDLAALRDAMAVAHPDRGGSSAAFIAARKRYLDAKKEQTKCR